ncbi:uncharacterized protein LOC125939817 [Dermacentor silvarum]|uniref:uncharacterized protein LOC125939817 n=1 Tax=Dermacentor silvarum TaxID=543639 RepID=UPI0021010878|nr:uncharacterized protein LOC125939817 [Dermacentor silvarum]
MATQNQRYTLVGFSRELDWKALNFVEPIPEYKTCNACGLVPRVTALLPCLHVVCQKCYEQCRHGDEHCCPLDGHRGLEEDVDWRKFTVNNLLKRKVKCWNEENGCDMVLAASELNKHFCQDCDYHSALCPKCSTVVLCRNMCAHLQSKCRNSAVSATSATLRTSNSDQNAVITALNATIDVRVGEIKDRLDCVTNYSDRFDSISHCINNMKETLLQSSIGSCTLESVPSQTADTLSSVRAVQDTLIAHGEKLHELGRTIKNSNKFLKGALEDTKRTVNSLKEDNAVNTLQVAFKDRLTADSGVLKKVCESVNELKETFGKELQEQQRHQPGNALSSSTASVSGSYAPLATDVLQSHVKHGLGAQLVRIRGVNLNHALYADDITIWCGGGSDVAVERALQAALDVTKEFLEGPGLVLSPTKSELLLYRPDRKSRKFDTPLDQVPMHLRTNTGQHIPRVDYLRVLGLVINAKGSNV